MAIQMEYFRVINPPFHSILLHHGRQIARVLTRCRRRAGSQLRLRGTHHRQEDKKTHVANGAREERRNGKQKRGRHLSTLMGLGIKF